MTALFQYCAEGLHVSCIRFGPLPNTVGGRRVECCCPCHHDEAGTVTEWKPSDADRMALGMAQEFGVDPRVEQIVEGRVEARAALDPPDSQDTTPAVKEEGGDLAVKAEALAASGAMRAEDAAAIRHAMDYADEHPGETPSFFNHPKPVDH